LAAALVLKTDSDQNDRRPAPIHFHYSPSRAPHDAAPATAISAVYDDVMSDDNNDDMLLKIVTIIRTNVNVREQTDELAFDRTNRLPDNLPITATSHSYKKPI